MTSPHTSIIVSRHREMEMEMERGHIADRMQTTGLSLPILLAHSALITPAACWMSMAGGGLVYGTILVYSGWFGVGDDDEF